MARTKEQLASAKGRQVANTAKKFSQAKFDNAKEKVFGMAKGVIPARTSTGAVKTGQRLQGKTVVPNLGAMRKKKIITSYD